MYGILGINQNAEACQRCGREDLNIIAIVGDETTLVVQGEYGTECAAQVMAELNGLPRPRRIALSDVQHIESTRRRQVADELRAGLREFAAGELILARWHAVEAARWNLLLRDDEQRTYARLLSETESVATHMDQR